MVYCRYCCTRRRCRPDAVEMRRGRPPLTMRPMKSPLALRQRAYVRFSERGMETGQEFHYMSRKRIYPAVLQIVTRPNAGTLQR
jgi:hypothetical protein